MIRLALVRFIESYFGHRWLYLLPAVLLTALGGVYAYIQPPRYQTTGVIYIENESYLSSLTSVRDSEYLWSPAQLVSNQVNDLLQTDAFIRAVIMQTDLEARMDEGSRAIGETMFEVRDSVWTSAIGENHMELHVLHENPETAHQLAESTLNSFTQWQITSDLNQSVAAEEFLSDVIIQYAADVEETRDALEEYLRTNPEPQAGERSAVERLEIERLRRELDAAIERYSNALDKEENARLATAQTESDVRQRFFVVDAPPLPVASNRGLRSMAIDAAIFGILGAMISVAMIVTGALMDRTIRLPVDAHALLDAEVLATIPRAKASENRSSLQESPGVDQQLSGQSPQNRYAKAGH